MPAYRHPEAPAILFERRSHASSVQQKDLAWPRHARARLASPGLASRSPAKPYLALPRSNNSLPCLAMPGTAEPRFAAPCIARPSHAPPCRDVPCSIDSLRVAIHRSVSARLFSVLRPKRFPTPQSMRSRRAPLSRGENHRCLFAEDPRQTAGERWIRP